MSIPQGKHFKEFCKILKELNYKDQACFFLNAYWDEYSQESKNCWNYVAKFNELDESDGYGKNGVSLNDIESQRFLENFTSITSFEFLEKKKILKEIDLDEDNKISFLEYAVWKYKLDIDTLMTRFQSKNDDIKKAETALKEVQLQITSIQNQKNKIRIRIERTRCKSQKKLLLN